MSLNTENSRRVAKSRPVCMGLKATFTRCDLSCTSGVWNLLLTSHFLLIQIMAKFETQPLYACLFVDYIH
jgi:hypothetical protein